MNMQEEKMDKKNAGTHNELVITRVFDAPRMKVWNAWKDPELFKRWWGGKDFTSPVSIIDFRIGGKILYSMRGPDGKDIWGTGMYKEIVPMEKIVVTDSFADEKGKIVPASYYGMPGAWTEELTDTVTFENIDGKTMLTIKAPGIPDESSEDAEQGWMQSLDKLDAALE